MKATTKLSFRDYLHVNTQLVFRKPFMWIIISVGVIFFALTILQLFGYSTPMLDFSKTPPDQSLIAGIFTAVVVVLAYCFMVRKQFNSDRRLQEKVDYEFGIDGLVAAGESYFIKLDWDKVHRVQELKNWIIIFQSNITANIISKKALGNELEAFRKLLHSKNLLS